MLQLEAKLLGSPTIKINGDSIDFPYKKVEALFYYIVVKKKVSRIKIASLLWGDMLDGKAKKNLRNALYQLKKVVGKGIINTPDRSTISICEDCQLDLDIDVFLNEEGEEAIEVYKGEFLNSFLIKNAPDFTDWIFEQRNYYLQLYIKTLRNYSKQLEVKEEFQQAIYYLKLLIEVDEFNEVAYRDLMGLYAKQGSIAKSVDIYKELEEQLHSELGITPDKKTVNLLQNIRERISHDINSNDDKKDEYIFRRDELDILINNLSRFLNDKSSASISVFGEAGIGKTTLVKQALSAIELKDSLILKANCFQAEERYIFKPWKIILQQLKKKVDFNDIDISLPWKKIISFLFPSLLIEEEEVLSEEMFSFESIQCQSATEALLFLLTEIAKNQKLILVFEDLQWCDDKSLFLLKNLIQESKNNNILIVMTSRNERKNRIENIFLDLKRHNYINEINLSRLSLSEVQKFANNSLSSYEFPEELVTKIYDETEGNTFFLVETLNLLKSKGKDQALSNLLTDKSKDILRNRVQSVSKEAQNILKLASICFDKVSYELLLDISGKNDFELIDLLEELQEYYLIEEMLSERNGSPAYKFTHSKIREFIYNHQSFSRVKLLHKRIAQFIEQNLQQGVRNRDQYAKLIYHYSKAGDKLKHLEYLIKESEIYFHHTHELFPITSDKSLEKDQIISFNQEGAHRYLTEISSLLEEVEQEVSENLVIREMKVKFLRMQAQFLISEGDYSTAIDTIQNMISEARNVDDWLSILRGYQQMAGLGVQKEEVTFIEDNAERMYSLAEEMEKDVEMAIALRFLGIAKLYQRNYQASERLFKNSLQIFKDAETLGKKYTLGIAVIYNYLGEVKRYERKFEEAINFYRRGISLCKSQNINWGLGIFHVNAGQVFFELEEYDKARTYFNNSLEIFKKLKTIWGYSAISNGFMSLLSIQRQDYEKAYDYLITAEETVKQYHKRYWLGILLRIKAEIAKEMKENGELAKVFKGYLNEDYSKYAKDALSILEEIGADYEIELVDNLS
ncbi:AAA family ATPase [Selenihalanaerobacter shriftii]|uniref:Predicted ATPase n=1 Tax=Selenihalanaerobacter shriftii TaxID=142842 RepID=A0A1T4MQ66_9FIRM|nr:AAA family ATPase [Selenihalanaerobacter shriftii]SJZ68956.1 Predicted ATPase [Selenihalanaerobacter shriftii]